MENLGAWQEPPARLPVKKRKGQGAGAIAGETTGSAENKAPEVYLDTEDRIEGKNENDVWISGAGIQVD